MCANRSHTPSRPKGEEMGPRTFGILALVLLIIVFPARLRGQSAPGAPGAIPTWTPASKEAVGTATSTDSRVWFTLQGGVLTEVYYPRLDTANVRTLEFAVSDGKKVWIESRDMEHSIDWINENALAFRQTSSDPDGHFKIEKTYATDPQRDTLLIDVHFSGSADLSLYVLYNPALKNSGYGDTGYSQGDALLAEKDGVASALVSSPGFAQMATGFAG